MGNSVFLVGKPQIRGPASVLGRWVVVAVAVAGLGRYKNRACLPALALASPAALAAWTLNMTPGITAISRRVYELHMLMFWWCVAIGFFVFGWMIYSLVVFRKSRGAVADAKLVHNTKAEIIWTVLPVFILIGMAVPATRTLIETEDATNTELTIRITGYQWKWGYQYVDSGVEVFSTLDRASNAARQLGSGIDPTTVPNYLLNVDHPLVVPAGVKVRLLITAQDVIHAWWVPALGDQEGRHPGLHQRGLVRDRRRQDRHLPRPMRGTVRPRSRLHADRRRRTQQGRFRRLDEDPEGAATAGRSGAGQLDRNGRNRP